MAGGHVLRHGGVLVIATHALMRRNPLALVEDLDGAGGGSATRRAGARRQRLERRPVDLLEQPAARHAEPPDRPLVVEPGEQLADRCVDLGEAVEGAVAQAAEQPALDDEDGLLGRAGKTAVP